MSGLSVSAAATAPHSTDDTRRRDNSCVQHPVPGGKKCSQPTRHCRDEALFVARVPDQLICPVGQAVLASPVVTPCRHEFCRSCLTKALQHREECPLCRHPVTIDDLHPSYESRNSLFELLTVCDNKEAGCSWVGEWGLLQGHREECAEEVVYCPHPGCPSTPRPRKKLTEHVAGCEWYPVACKHCKEPVAGCHREEHEMVCPERIEQCSVCGAAVRARESQRHLELECPLALTPCPFTVHGCTAAPMQRSLLGAHLHREATHHSLLLAAKLQLQTEALAICEARILKLLRRTTITVSPQGKGNFVTIQEALDEAEPNDRIIVRPGIYKESLVLGKGVVLEADGEVLLRNNGESNVIVMRQSCTLLGFTLRQSSRGFFCIRVTSQDQDTVVSGCDVQSEHFSCIQIDSGADPLIEKNRIHDSRQCGVLVKRQGLGRIHDNDIFNNCLSNVYVDAEAAPVLRGNRIHSSQQHGVWVRPGSGGFVGHNTIYNNIMSDIKVEDGATPKIVKNNFSRPQTELRGGGGDG